LNGLELTILVVLPDCGRSEVGSENALVLLIFAALECRELESISEDRLFHKDLDALVALVAVIHGTGIALQSRGMRNSLRGRDYPFGQGRIYTIVLGSRRHPLVLYSLSLVVALRCNLIP
jgi:hypothetical protein